MGAADETTPDRKGGKPLAGRASGKDGSSPAKPGDGSCHASDDGEIEKYLLHLAHLDMALPLKIELVRALRAIMQSFVDRAFGDDPVQQALAAGGKSYEAGDRRALPVIQSGEIIDTQSTQLSRTFRNPAAGADGRK